MKFYPPYHFFVWDKNSLCKFILGQKFTVQIYPRTKIHCANLSEDKNSLCKFIPGQKFTVQIYPRTKIHPKTKKMYMEGPNQFLQVNSACPITLCNNDHY